MASRKVQDQRLRNWLLGHPLSWPLGTFEGCRREEFLALERTDQIVLIVKFGLAEYARLIGFEAELEDQGKPPIEDSVILTNDEMKEYFSWGTRQNSLHRIQQAMRKLLNIRLRLPEELAAYLSWPGDTSGTRERTQ